MAGSDRKVIVTCAITGAIHTPTMSDALPFRPEDIARQAIDAAEAGAAVIHLHARNPRDGSVSLETDDFMRVLPTIKQSTDAVINITTGGSVHLPIEKRLAPSKAMSPEMCSLNMGSINFSFHRIADRYQEWQFDWEEDYVRNSDSYIFRNSFRDIAQIAKELGGDHHVKFEHECYDVGHLYNLRYCLDDGLFEPPIFVQFVLGVRGGLHADIANLVFMKQTADRLFADQFQWSVLGAGSAQMPMATHALLMGGNVRVGLEDSLFIERGKLAASNAEQVAKVRRIAEELGYEIATPTEARSILGLKGGDRVNF